MANDHAIVCKIKNIRSHPNADKVQLGTACGFQVVIGLEVKENDLGIYFPTDTCLGKDFAEANPELLTYFGKNRRVRTQKFRGEKSEGFWCEWQNIPLQDGDLTKRLNEGQHISTEEGVEICKKYINPQTLNKRNHHTNKPKKFRTGSLPTFQKHEDTDQLRYNWERLIKNAHNEHWIWTVKVHGTSQRVGNVLVLNDVDLLRPQLTKLNSLRQKKFKTKYSFITDNLSYFANQTSRFINFIRYKVGVSPTKYEYLVGTRNVILGELKTDGTAGRDGFYSDEFRSEAAKPFIGQLKKGEVIYYEVVGYLPNSGPIMGTIGVKDKEIKKQYGKEVIYSYGCSPGEFDIYVYRIAYQTEEGVNVDLTWDKVKERCNELGVKHVPEAEALNCFDLETIQKCIEQPDPIDPRHPMEGVVLRIESSKPRFYKEKSFTFKVLEGIIKDSDQIDLEDAS